jgi:hypothetical protein
MADKRDIRRRVIGTIFLAGALAMVVTGETVLREKLRSNPAAFLVFWMVCVILVGISILIAILDLAVMRRRLREEQRQLVEDTIRQIEQAKGAKAAQSPKTRPDSK